MKTPKLNEILKGIDQDSGEEYGWWETSCGAEFGSKKLKEVQDLVKKLSIDNVSKSVAKQYAEFCVRCDRDGLPLLQLDDYIKHHCS